MSDAKKPGAIVYEWWRAHIGNRNSSAARALAARLRRATAVEALSERPVHDLARSLRLTASDADRLVRLVRILAEVRDGATDTLAKILGGDNPVLSPLRFQRLMRAEGEDLTVQLRRAVIMADRECNVADLGGSILNWGEETRIRWTFDYFRKSQSDRAETGPAQTEETIR